MIINQVLRVTTLFYDSGLNPDFVKESHKSSYDPDPSSTEDHKKSSISKSTIN